jgi:surfactin synthase thioesterase subunit
MDARWIYRQETVPASFRLFCFPYAGGTAAAYHAWQGDFSDGVQVCAIEPPGRRHRMRERPCERLVDLADAVIDGIAGDLDLPFAFFGHSLGALVAFETARRLQLGGAAQPVVLFLSAAAAPHLPRTVRRVWDLPNQEFLSELEAYDGTPPAILDDPALAEVFLPILRADFRLFETYSCRPPTRLDRPVRLYGGTRDPRVSPARLCAWRELAPVESVELFDGGHFYLRSSRPALTASIGRRLLGATSNACMV